MQKLYIILFISFVFNISALSAHIRPDSIGVENNNGKKVILHKVESKETYYALGRKYNVSPKDIIAFNQNKSLVPGVTIRVPTERPFSGGQAKPVTQIKQAVTTATEHIVKPKENLGQIAEKYHTTVAALRDANGITGSNLSIGQVLKIPVSGTEAPVQIRTEEVKQSTPAPSTGNYTVHVVQKKEFLNKIAEKYSTTVEELKRINNLSSNNLSIGQILKVPANGETQTAQVNEPAVEKKQTQTITNEGSKHTVISGETIYSIAHKYDLTTYQIRQANNLDDNATLTVGQKLNIPLPSTPKSVSDVAREEQQYTPDTSSTTIKDPSLKREAQVYGLNQAEEKGTAVWVSDPDLDPTKMMVLHRTLKVGSVIKITNPMTNISAFVKVVGKFTENETTKDVIIVITKAVADKLGVLDKRFFCNITYAPQENNEQ